MWYRIAMRLVCVLLMPFAIWAAEPETLIKDLDADDYQTRENASKQLESLSEDKLQWLIDQHMKTLKQPEVSTRLYVVAQKLFIKTTLLKTNEYRQFRAWMGVKTTTVYEKRNEEPKMLPEPQFVDMRNDGMEHIVFIDEDGPCHNVLKEGDVVEYLKVDNGWVKPPIKIPLMADEVLKFQVRRYTDPKKAFEQEEIFCSSVYLNKDNKDFKLIEVEVKVGWKPNNYSIEESEAIAQRQWVIYLGKASSPKE